MSARPPGDAPARTRAATDFERNLCVTAGAGCGKTSLLVERVLHAVLARGTPLERIAAITFTEKAAAEMRERVLAALLRIEVALADAGARARTAADVDDEAGRALARLGALDLATLRARIAAALAAEPAMSTLHSFALRLLLRHPVEADLPADVAMDLGDGFRRHTDRVLPDLLEELLDERAQPAEEAAALRRVLARLRLDEFAELARDAAWLPEEAPVRAPDALAAIRARCVEAAAALAKARGRVVPKGNQAKLFEQWDALVDALRRASAADSRFPLQLLGSEAEALDTGKSTAQPQAGDAAAAAAARACFDEAFDLVQAARAVDEEITGDVATAARAVGQRLAASFVRSGFLPADGALARAAGLLARREKIRQAEAARFDLLLVDEFQDTDPLQCEIVLWLAEGKTARPAKTLAELKLAPGRLFLVGDPKQSIYRFRGADLEAYARASKRVLEQGGEELFLKTNFRSRPGVIGAVNGLFKPWIGPRSDVEPDYVELEASRAPADAGTPAVEVLALRLDHAKTRAGERRRAEGHAIAAEIAARNARGVGYGQIALLLRRLTDLGAYVQALRERAIPHVLAGGTTFVERSEVGELLSLLLALADPQDDVASLGALRSTLCAVPDADLHAAARTHGTLRWPALVGSPVASVAGAARELERLHAIVRAEPAAAAVERVVEASLLLPISGAARDGEQRIANLRKLAHQVVARVEETRLPLALALRDLLASHDHSDGEAERSLADAQIDAVRILTIHGAKGLEFDHVFVADLVEEGGRGDRSANRIALLVTPHGPRIAVELPALGVRNAAAILRAERERRHEVAEKKRLFYVACTRARERLLLVSSAQADDDSPWIEPLHELGYVPGSFDPADGPLRHGVHQRVVTARSEPAAGPRVAVGGADVLESAQRYRHAAAAARAAAPRFARPSDAEAAFERELQRDEAGAEVDAPRAVADGTVELARAVGIACHVALAASGCAAAPTSAQIERAAAVAAHDTSAAAPEIERAATALLRSAPVRALQQSLAGVKVRAVELPLLLARDGIVWRGSADLVFEEGGELVVADWKSDRVEGDAALDALATRYRPQLELYRDAVAAALAPGEPGRATKPPRIELLLLRAGRRLAL